MAIVLTKKKVVSAPALEPELDVSLSEFADLIDEVGRLQEEAEKISQRIAREQEKLKPYNEAMAKLKAKIAELEVGPDDTITENGHNYYVEAGKQGTSREITDMKKVRELLGDELFMQLATVTLKNIDDYMTPPQKAQVINEKRTSRTIKVKKRVV